MTKKYLLQEIEFPTSGLQSVPGALPCLVFLFVSLYLFVFSYIAICLPFPLTTSIAHKCFLMHLSGDGEGGIEMTGSMQLIREFCDGFINPEKSTRTRIVNYLIILFKIPSFPFFFLFYQNRLFLQHSFLGTIVKLSRCISLL